MNASPVQFLAVSYADSHGFRVAVVLALLDGVWSFVDGCAAIEGTARYEIIMSDPVGVGGVGECETRRIYLPDDTPIGPHADAYWLLAEPIGRPADG